MLRPYVQHMKIGESRQVEIRENNLLDNLNGIVIMAKIRFLV
jgi:hypothetical protein